MKNPSNRFPEEREQIVLELLCERGRITINEVIEALGISASTARLQLQHMHEKGLLQRTHGGAVPVEHQESPVPASIPGYQRFQNIDNLDKKLQIAHAALQTIEDGDYIAISSGTTAMLLASMLRDKRNLTVVTDAIPIANELYACENIRLYVCGGEIRNRNGACHGPTAEDFLNTLRVDKSYCGIDSIDVGYGVTSRDLDPRTERALCHCGKVCYILADSTKFCVKPFIEKIISIEEVSYLISDSSLEQHYIDALNKKNVHVIIGSDPQK